MKNYKKIPFIVLCVAALFSCKKETPDSTIKVNSISVDKTLYLEVGESKMLNATVLPKDATDKTVSWKSSNELIVTVSADGKVTAIKEGITDVTASAGGVTSQKCDVTVVLKKIPVTSVIIDKVAELKVGGIIQLIATILPGDATDKTISWKSNNEAIVTVDADGKLTGLKEGSANITATAAGVVSEICVVTVSNSIEYIEMSDVNFKKYILEEFDNNKDGKISKAEALEVTEIALIDVDIASMDDIVNFPNLTKLYCNRNKLNSIDISKNTALIDFSCSYNNITSLDVSKNTLLETLWCDNNQLSNIDISKNTELKSFSCSVNNIEILNVSNNVNLEYLYFRKNLISDINLSKNIAVQSLNGSENKLTAIDVSACSKLSIFECSKNTIAAINLTNNTLLTELYLQNNSLTAIDISKNVAIKTVNINKNEISTIDLSKNIALLTFDCFDNKISNIDISNNVNLIKLDCTRNKVTELNVSKNVALEVLYFSENDISSIDLSKSVNLEDMKCRNTLLATINVSNNTGLISMDCSDNNNLTKIFISSGQNTSGFTYNKDNVTLETI